MPDEFEDLDVLIQKYLSNWALDTETMASLGIAFTVLLIITLIGNGLVLFVVVRKRQMWTTRNMFIVNLTISNLILCCFAIPFSLAEILTRFFRFGLFMCKLTLALESASLYVSAFNIISITLAHAHAHSKLADYGKKRHTKVCLSNSTVSIFMLSVIWLGGSVLALPLYIYSTIETHMIGIPEIDPIAFCLDNWPIQYGRSRYSMHFLYVVPITFIGFVCLCVKISKRARSSATNNSQQLSSSQFELSLPISVFLIFCFSSLPLNVLNIVAGIDFLFDSERSFRLTIALCHMAGMISPCCNPFLYGWLDPNFRAEFKEIFYWFKRCFTVCLGRSEHNLHDNSPNHHELVQL